MDEKTPLEILNYWDYVVFICAMLVRLASSILVYESKNKDKKIGDYFKSLKHQITWFIDIMASLTLLFSLSQFVSVNDIKYINDWSYLGSAIVGFLGYDLVKYLIMLVKLIVKSKLSFLNKKN